MLQQLPENSPMNTESPLVENIRLASRLMVRELGFMNTTLAATKYSPSAVHSLLEIEARGKMTAKQLVDILCLEKSSVSRMLGKLVSAGELRETASEEDARIKELALTERGQESVNRINAYGKKQVFSALAKLNPGQQQAVTQGMAAYAYALQSCREENAAIISPPVVIKTGYQSGLIGRIAEMHAHYYSLNHGFGRFFEAKVAAGLSDFTGRLDEPCNQVWTAMVNGRIVGSVAIDGQDLGNGEAHLRWFILDDSCRGNGLGKRLLHEAIKFCDDYGFSSVQLWTFDKLTAARRLYESFGFEMVKEWQGEQWGNSIMEQQFTRKFAAA
jgi:DNA-binding MarR family transcriptional regulator/GNAT superfamily N-acetyltransferase